jgi:hypothetical protein
MAWEYVARGALAQNTDNSLTMGEPAGMASGDLMVACIGYYLTALFCPPTGWTEIQEVAGNSSSGAASIRGAVMYYIIRGASAPDLVFARTSALGTAAGHILGYRGHATSSVLDTSYVNQPSGTSSNTYRTSAAGLTTGTAGCLLVGLAVCNGGADAITDFKAATAPSTGQGQGDTAIAPVTTEPTAAEWTNRAINEDFNSTCFHIADAIKTTAGATGAFTAHGTGSGTMSFLVAAFKPLVVATARRRMARIAA